VLHIDYTCHLATMHWAFMDLGDTDALANAKVAAVSRSQCHGCAGAGLGGHPGLPSVWYAARFCGGSTAIPNRAALHGAVSVGDVLVVRKNDVVHSMVVVRKSLIGPHRVYIRGFNNFGTLGTGPGNGYDNQDRDIDAARYWHTQGVVTRFGTGFATGGDLAVIGYALYSGRAAHVRNNCALVAGVWTYNGL